MLEDIKENVAKPELEMRKLGNKASEGDTMPCAN